MVILILRGVELFNEEQMVESYFRGENIPKRALDDCVFQIAKYCKERGKNEIETKTVILQWLSDNHLFFTDINNNIDNAFKTKTKLTGSFCVYINSTDIERINFAADFKQSKRVALFLLIYAKLHADANGEFKIRVSTMSEWIGIDRSNLYKRHISPLITYGFLEAVEQKSYNKYLNQKREEKRYRFRIPYKLVNEGEYCITRNDDFQMLFNRIFVEGGHHEISGIQVNQETTATKASEERTDS